MFKRFHCVELLLRWDFMAREKTRMRYFLDNYYVSFKGLRRIEYVYENREYCYVLLCGEILLCEIRSMCKREIVQSFDFREGRGFYGRFHCTYILFWHGNFERMGVACGNEWIWRVFANFVTKSNTFTHSLMVYHMNVYKGMGSTIMFPCANILLCGVWSMCGGEIV